MCPADFAPKSITFPAPATSSAFLKGSRELRTVLFNFGYNFNLYLRGPYSSQFTKDFYEIKNTSEYKEVEIENQEGELLLNELSNVINEYTSDVGILELTSSLLYLNKLGTGNNIEHLIKKLKPGFSEEQYRLSLELFEQLRIIRRR